MALAVVRDLRPVRPVPDGTDLDAFEQDLIAGFVLARSAAGVTDKSIQAELRAVGEFRESMGRHLWTARPDYADRLLGQRCRGRARATIAGKAFAISVFFQYLELRHQVEIHAVTGETVQCPIDEMNRPRDDWSLNVRIPPADAELEKFFDGWRDYLTTARKYLPAARGYAAARLWSQVGLRIGETRRLDMTDVLWESGPLGKLHVRFGKGSRRRGPKQRITPLTGGSRPLLEWFVTDVRGQFDDRWDQPGAPLLCSERKTTDGDACRVSAGTLRVGLARAVARHPPPGGAGSARTCCGTTARPRFTATAWTSSPSRSSSATNGSPPPWDTCTSTALISKTPGRGPPNAQQHG